MLTTDGPSAFTTQFAYFTLSSPRHVNCRSETCSNTQATSCETVTRYSPFLIVEPHSWTNDQTKRIESSYFLYKLQFENAQYTKCAQIYGTSHRGDHFYTVATILHGGKQVLGKVDNLAKSKEIEVLSADPEEFDKLLTMTNLTVLVWYKLDSIELVQKPKRIVHENGIKLSEILQPTGAVTQGTTITCPFCHQVFQKPHPTEVLEGLFATVDQDPEKARRMFTYTQREQFCRRHRIETICKPLAEERSYPLSFREEVIEKYQKLGKRCAKSPMTLYMEIDNYMPGYYGALGGSVILDTLHEMYIPMLMGPEYHELVSPLAGQEFVQQVLFQEVGVLLIQNDLTERIRNGQLNEYDELCAVDKMRPAELYQHARAIMKTSHSYGSIMFPAPSDD
ncbi:hypothetical protein BJV82DRAFT_675927 [Fennellomyces sp. T-0311]|nr:hypothetical protein BJV82DRAFT_675927 [Fennellomyces sp. T-0311]